MSKPEQKIQKKVIAHARERWGAECWKNEVGAPFYNNSGRPDYTIFPDLFRDPGKDKRVFFVEFKAPGGVLTPLQRHMRKKLEAMGYKYYLIDSAVRGCMLMDELLS